MTDGLTAHDPVYPLVKSGHDLYATVVCFSFQDALNLLFLGIPLLNITLPLVWKSFPFIFSADVMALASIYAWKVCAWSSPRLHSDLDPRTADAA